MKKLINLKKSICFLLSIFLISISNSFGQAVICPSVNAQVTTGPSTTICQGSCAVLTATVPPVRETTTYSVGSIGFAPQPTVGATAINLTDDSQAGPFPIGFNFCFFGNNYTQFWIGSNGWIAFSAGQSNAFTSATIPSGAFNVPRNCIMGPWQDWNPGIAGGPYIRYQTLGTAPCRRLVVTWSNCPMFSCTTTYGTFQIIIYETTNIIENHLTNKPNCLSWAGGTAVQGIHNLPGTIGITVPGRNSTQWTAVNQGWRWTPTGAPTFTINWVGPTGPVGTGSQVTVCPLSTGIYTANATLGGCVGNTNLSGTVQVVVQPTPTITVASASVCPGTGTTLIATGANTYTWQPGNIISPSASFTPPVTSIYTVVGTTTLGCVGTGTASITVNPQPTVNPTNNSPVCQGSQLSFSVGSATSYTWNGPNGFTSNLQNPIINPVTLAAAGNYTVRITAAGGCTAQAITNVTINPSPTVTSTSGSVCPGVGMTLIANGANTYTWQPGNIIGSSATFTPLATSVYTVTGASVAGCTSTSTSTIVVNTPPINLPINNGPVCVGSSINFTTTSASSYTWVGPNGFTSNLQNPTIPNSSLINAGNYTVTLTSAQGCTTQAITNVVVNVNPTVQIGNTGPYCAGSSIQLTVNPANTYTWTGPNAYTSNLQNPVIANSATNMTGAYIVTITSISGCQGTGTTNVVVNSLPTPTANSNSPVCVGSNINLSVNSATSYTWNGPNVFTSNLQNPNIATAQLVNSGIYTVSVTNAQGCVNSSTVNVVVNPLPNITVNSPTGCIGSTFPLLANGGVTYSWTPGTSLSSTNVVNPISSTTITTIYTVTSTDINGCISSAISTVVVNPLPVLSTTSSTTCAGINTTISASGANTYTWSNGGITPSIIVNPIVQTTYTVTGTSTAGCISSSTATVFIAPPLVVNLTSNSPLCVGGNLNLTSNIGSIWNWTGPNSFTSNVQNPTINNVTTLNGGTYSVNVIDANGCTGTSSINVVVNSLPTPTIITNSPICSNQNIVLNGLGGVTYTWTGPGFTSNSPNPTINGAGVGNSGTYTLTVTDANGCINSTSANFTVHPLPIVSALGSTVCSGSTMTLSSFGGVQYSWTGPNGFTSNSQNISVPNSNVSMSGIYIVTVTDVNGCVSSNMANVSIIPPFTVNVTNNSPICQGGTLYISTDLGYGYTWSGPNGFTSNLSSPYILNVQPSASGIYFVSLIDANGCTSSASTSVTINPNPVVSIVSNGGNVCVPGCVSFTTTSTNKINDMTWFFSNGSVVTSSVTTQCFTKGGVYTSTVNVKDINGCKGTATNSVEVYSNPIADFSFSPIKPVDMEEVSFTNTSTGNVTEWYWFFNSQNVGTTVQNPVVTYEVGTYPVTLIVRTNKGCSDTITKIINVSEDFDIFIPNSFTPNSDGLNDIFQPKGRGISKYNLMIFDRWGEMLFQSNDFSNGWDGSFKGEICKNDVYVWVINITNLFGKSREFKGHVTLMK